VSSALRLTSLLLRILCFSLIAWPVFAEERVDPLLDETVPAIASTGNVSALGPLQVPIEPIPADGPIPSPAAPQPRGELLAVPDGAVESSSTATACPPQYWMVSTRCSAQSIHERCRAPWGVQVFERACDGRFLGSSMQSLSAQLVPGAPVCIFVHGSFVKWESQCQEAHALYSRLRAGCAMPQMIFFTWPSDGPYTGVFPIDLAVRGRQADFNSFHLGYLLSQIPASCPVCLIGHSHGTRVILATMQLAAGGTVEGCHFPYSMGNGRRYRLVLAAGAIDHDWLNPGQPYDRALYPVECLLNLRNRSDLPLTFFPLTRPFARRAIARSGVTNHDLRHLGYNAAKIREADVTQMVGHSHYWPEYYRHPAVLGAMLPYMLFY
jgi:hypothetical protein